MNNFIPDKLSSPTGKVPYFDDMAEKKIKGYGVTKSLEFYEKSIRKLLDTLGAARVVTTVGKFPVIPPRYGYRIDFTYEGIPGRIECAALPLRSETFHRKDRALSQALYLLSLELEAQVNAWVYKPGSIPLVPYLIGNSGRTVTEEMIVQARLPEMSPAGYLEAPNGSHR